MAQIKLRIRLNEGRDGAPLEKLGQITAQIDRFLRSLAADLRIETKRGEWLALNFRNGSVSYDAAFQVEVPDSKLRHFNQCVEFVADFDPDAESSNGLVSEATLLEFGKLGERIDPDESIGLGLYAPERKRLKWRRVEYRKASRIRQAIESPIRSYGSIQGMLHSLFKEVDRPYFQLRELATDNLVRCFYPDRLYENIIEGLRHKTTIVHASGQMDLDRAKKTVGEMRVERLDRVEPLEPDDFRGFFGVSPNLTGNLTTQQYIDQVRSDG